MRRVDTHPHSILKKYNKEGENRRMLKEYDAVSDLENMVNF